MACKELTLSGLKYTDEETGEDREIKRYEDDSGYKYTEKMQEYKEALFMNCKLKHPTVDPYVLEILIDFYLNHPEKFKEASGTNYDTGFTPEDLNKQWNDFNENTIKENIES